MERGSIVDAQLEFEQQKDLLQEKAFQVFNEKIKSPNICRYMKEKSAELFKRRILKTII